MKLHEDTDVFLSMVTSVSQHLGLPEVYIEKDYWVTRSLKNLAYSDIADQVVFKGGTSLSKAHKIIHRFSEDIDLAVKAGGLGDSRRKKLLKVGETVASVGLEPIVDDARNSKGSKFLKSVYQYPRIGVLGNYGQASPELLIELNTFTQPEPSEEKTIQSMIADLLAEQGMQDLIEKYELASFKLNVLSLRRTLIEKLLGIIKDSYLANPLPRLNERIRHIFDIWAILTQNAVRDFVASKAFQELINVCIEDEINSWGDERSRCFKQPLHQAPLFQKFKAWWPGLERTYNGVFADLVYGDLPKVEEILEELGFLHSALKKIE